MRKKDELTREHTCMQHAHPEEMVFVLLSRDAAAPVAIRSWVAERIRLGKNVETDEQIVEALACAAVMEIEGSKWKGIPSLRADQVEMQGAHPSSSDAEELTHAQGRSNADNKCSISVSGKLYDKLCTVVPYGGMASFVDEAIVTALDDPAILKRLLSRCRGEGAESLQ